MLLSFWLLNWQYVHWDESAVIQYGPILKNLVFKWDQKPDRDDLMFVNVSNDNQLTDIFDDFGFPMGNVPITDRGKLSLFFEALAKNNNHKAIICDIRFDLPAENDSLLQSSFNGLERYIVSNHVGENKLDTVVLDINTAISDYPVTAGAFFKFEYIVEDTLKTLPVAIHEMISNIKIAKKGPFLSDGSDLYFNTFLPELQVRPFDLFDSEDHYFYDDLGNLLYLDEESLREITKDKLIVIG